MSFGFGGGGMLAAVSAGGGGEAEAALSVPALNVDPLTGLAAEAAAASKLSCFTSADGGLASAGGP